MARLPNLPVEEEGRLGDPRLRENFVERVFAYRRLCALFEGRWTVGAVVQFHTAHKLTLMAHSPVAYRELGQLVAGGKAAAARRSLPPSTSRASCARWRSSPRPKRQANVLQHMLGYFSKAIDSDARHETAVADRRAPPGTGPAHRSDDADAPSCAPAERRVSAGPDLPRAAPARAEPQESCLARRWGRSGRSRQVGTGQAAVGR